MNSHKKPRQIATYIEWKKLFSRNFAIKPFFFFGTYVNEITNEALEIYIISKVQLFLNSHKTLLTHDN